MSNSGRDALAALVAALQSGTQPPAPVNDPFVLTSVLTADLLSLAQASTTDLQSVSNTLNTNLAAKANSGANSDITSLTGLTTPLTPAQLPVRRSQLLAAISQNLTGGLTSFLQSGFVAASPDDPSNVAFYHEPFALPGGGLATALLAYLQAPTTGDANGRTGLGLTSTQASAQINTLFSAAKTINPNT